MLDGIKKSTYHDLWFVGIGRVVIFDIVQAEVVLLDELQVLVYQLKERRAFGPFFQMKAVFGVVQKYHRGAKRLQFPISLSSQFWCPYVVRTTRTTKWTPWPTFDHILEETYPGTKRNIENSLKTTWPNLSNRTHYAAISDRHGRSLITDNNIDNDNAVHT